MTSRRSAWSRLNGWRVLVELWRQPEPPEFHWRLLRYFCWTRAAVALLLVGYVWLPLERAAPDPGVAAGAAATLAANPRMAAALPVVLPYLCIAMVTLVGTLWRRHFHVRVRVQVMVDLALLAGIFAVVGRLGSHAEGLAMIFLLPALEAGALTSLMFALFTAAVSALVVMGQPFVQTLLVRQADANLLGSGLFGLVFMIAALVMYMLANRQIAQEQIALAREQELRLQQLVNRLMVNDMQDGVMLVRANGVVVAANPAAVVLLGVQPHERIREGQVRAGERDKVLFDLRRIPRLQPLMEMLRDWIQTNDDVPRILQLLPLPSRPSALGGPMLHTRLRLRFVLPGLAGLRSTLGGALTAPSALDTVGWNDMSPEGAARLRLAIAQNEAMAWSPEDETLLRSEMRDTVLVHIESWERIAEQVQQEKLAGMGRLVASVAHQIRNPLAAISQANELLADSGAGEGNIDARLLRIISDNVRRLDQVVSDVLQLSRRPRTGHSAVELGQALPEIVERWRLEMRSRGGPRADINANAIRLAVDLQRPVIFDAAQLQQVLGNLLDNAWRYCSRLPGAIRLLAHALDQHHAELIVWNDGAEVTREQQRSLFEPFFTSNAQGTGLGLFMARELCGANDAQVRYGTIALEPLLDRTGLLGPGARDTLPAKAFVLTMRIETPDVVTAAQA
ncbi:multi-sensor signal transduction histidine kinase [Cupriavidus sp. OV038]|jgi:two-component system sensor histidine kinase PilS (NtrC family)|uniref:sensor histidine kinase n=1 Tax=unclassified Cupriavidus TaxID=2640874 RepID=UPI0008E7963D|nr:MULTISPECIES: ATP-binding protein [unclassified Cupriavidus]SFD14535.1 multi-sensor signal transduction histidine kinase [Cupriavidus sp. OV038]SFP81342.1 two-component system, NtrC family, sensor histidine kinase PilS [Cupriavidus sp. OV096]